MKVKKARLGLFVEGREWRSRKPAREVKRKPEKVREKQACEGSQKQSLRGKWKSLFVKPSNEGEKAESLKMKSKVAA